jgi:hypothetical protein
MIWGDGTCFDGMWENDERAEGRLVMSNGWVYIGKFKNDKPHDMNGKLLMTSMVIYQGEFKQGKTSPLGMLLYPNGDIYYG